MKIALVGSPNVGKSVIFHHLTGQYVTVSNYPGTTVEVTWGTFKWAGLTADVVDTPGIYSLLPISGEEQVTRELLLLEEPDLIVHVIDAKNLQRMLPLTLQLLETGLPVLLVLNMMDEVRARGLQIDTTALADKLNIPVLPTVSVSGEGIEALKQLLGRYLTEVEVPTGNTLQLHYPAQLENLLSRLQRQLKSDYPVAKRSIALFLLQHDEEIWEWVEELEGSEQTEKLKRVLGGNGGFANESDTSNASIGGADASRLNGNRRGQNSSDTFSENQSMGQSSDYRERQESNLTRGVWSGQKSKDEESINADWANIASQIILTRQKKADQILRSVFDTSAVKTPHLQTWLSQLCTRPLTGIPILLLVLYFGIYKFVGEFGAGVIVDFLDRVLFQQGLNPLFTEWAARFLPSETLQLLFVGEYGILTLGIRYAVAIILPIVGMFFFAFSILEDSGYFPRLALLIDRLFKVIGLNGRAVIPMVLGLGCDTMATLTTRILETRRERVIATLLLALAIPCSAQLGVITSLLSTVPGGMAIWLGVVGGMLLLVGYLTSKIIPGAEIGFYMEVPTLRVPKLSNILAKTRARMQWYFLEILPIFIYSSVIIWVGQITGFFEQALKWLEPLMLALGLPREAAVTFLFGFFRRDYGAAGLFDLHRQGLVTGDGLIVSCVTLTLFVPCVAQFVVMMKEHGVKTGLLISGFIFPFAFLVGFVLHQILSIL